MKGRLRLAVHLVGLLLLGLIVWWGGPEAWREVSQGQPGPILIAFLLTGLANVLSAVRLRLVAQAASPDTKLPWRRLYYMTMAANTAGLILPRSVSTVGGKSVGLKALGVSVRRSVSIVFIDNAFDLFLLLPLIAPAFFYLRGGVSADFFYVAVMGVCLGLAAVLWWGLESGRIAWLAGGLEGHPRLRFLERFQLARVVRLLPSRPVSMQVLGLTVLLNGALALRFYYIAQAVSLPDGPALFIAAFPMTQLSLVFGGLGIFDASWYGVLLLAGMGEQAALTFVIAQRAYIFLYILFWTGLSFLLSLTK